MATAHERLVGLTTALARAFATWSDAAEPPFRHWRAPVVVGGRRLVITIQEDSDGRDDAAEADSGSDSE